jgi:uncharacterized membrane protein YbhN (UPF0104 family)
MKLPWPRFIRTILSLGGTIVLLAWVISQVDASKLRTMFSGAEWGWFILAAILVPIQIVLASWRWRRISNDLGLPLSRLNATSEFGLSTLLNQVLPGGVVGDAIRVWRQRSGHGTFGGPLRAAVVDRAIGHVAHVAVTAFGLGLWIVVHPTPPPEIAWAIVGTIAVVLMCVWNWPVPGVRRVIADARTALTGWHRALEHTTVSIVLVGLFLLCFWCCAQALHLPLGVGAITAVPLLMLALVLPISVGGWGLREVSATAVLGTLGWSVESSVALSAAYGMVNLVGASPAALVFLRTSGGAE